MNRNIPAWCETYEHLRTLWQLYWGAREERSLFGPSRGINGPETEDSLRIKATIIAVTQAIMTREALYETTVREHAKKIAALEKAALDGVKRALTHGTGGT